MKCPVCEATMLDVPNPTSNIKGTEEDISSAMRLIKSYKCPKCESLWMARFSEGGDLLGMLKEQSGIPEADMKRIKRDINIARDMLHGKMTTEGIDILRGKKV